MPANDMSEIEFELICNDDNTKYVLTIKCPDSLGVHEYCDCVESFVVDLRKKADKTEKIQQQAKANKAKAGMH